MKNLIAAIAPFALVASAIAQKVPADFAYSLRADQAYSGSVDRGLIAREAPYPLNKRYESFTPQEKATLRALYEGMPESDEPPFPSEGLKYIIGDISTLTGSLRAEGELTIFVAVNTRGEATNVKLVNYPNLEIAKAIAYVLVKARYKPGICAGLPCALEFPFRFTLTRD